MRDFAFLILTAGLLVVSCSGKPEEATEASAEVPRGASSGGVNPDSPINEQASIFCDAIQQDTTIAACGLVEKQIAGLRNGAGALDAPEKVTRGKTATVRFSIAPTADSGVAEAAAVTGQGKQTVTLPVKIGSVMSASLESGGFEISPSGEQVRNLGASKKADWIWKAKAVEGGSQELLLTVKAKALDANGKPIELDLYTETQTVGVKVTTIMWLQDMLGDLTGLFSTTTGAIKALTALIVALAALWGAARFWKRKDSLPPRTH